MSSPLLCASPVRGWKTSSELKAPTATIAGGNTRLDFPDGIALDGAGNIYVANNGVNDVASITVYAAGASGNATPMVTIAGSNTGLTNPTLITF